ncbi:hypothetical protein C5E45_04095 [Nocardia nova]|uniref:TetR family transcriptional regulator n=2 Tax=Nocardia nova TaxID=37330 RepID=A0A2S6AVT7_9NOCA|nr:hypothetical protein C5E41_03015 [Nocardia nova]PPJ39346.1 hypothetical protein C5E45_04095 [Nocardia nova]
MPQLASFMEVGVTSIYWYFKSKDELLEAMSRAAFIRFAELTEVDLSGRWDEILRRYFRVFRDVLEADPVLCDFIVVRVELARSTDHIEPTLRHLDEIAGVLVGAGFTHEQALLGYNSLSLYTRRAIHADRLREASVHERGFIGGLRGQLTRSVADEPPNLARGLDESTLDDNDEFEFGMNLIISGLHALLAESGTANKA